MNTPRRVRHARGFTLIEVLVAILIFSFGLLGFAGLQARAIQYSVSAEDTNRAALLANEMAVTMVTKNSVDPGSATLAPDVAAWQSRAASAPTATAPNSAYLPNGAASAAMTSAKVATLTITWRPTGIAAGAPPNRYVTQVVLP